MTRPTPHDYSLTDEEVHLLSIVENDRKRTCERVIKRIPYLCLFVVIAFLINVQGDKVTSWLKSCSFVAYASLPLILITIVSGFDANSPVLQVVGRWSRFHVSRRHSSYVRYIQFAAAKDEFSRWLNLTEQRLREHEERTRQSFWKQMDGWTFEREVKNLIAKGGKKAKLVGGANDKGIDILVDDDTVVQCKAHKNPVSPAVARELFGAMTDFGARRGILVSLNGFTTGVVEFVRNKPIELWDVNDLIGMQKRLAG